MSSQLTTIKNFDVSKIIFSDPVQCSVSSEKDSKNKIEYTKIPILTRYDDGSEGELIIPTEKVFSFGLSENNFSGNFTGYVFPLVLWSKDGPTEQEKLWTDTFNEIIECCIDHLMDCKYTIDKLFEIERSDLTKTKSGLNPLWWKREVYTNDNGKPEMRIVPGTGPVLYCKVMYSKVNNKFRTQFYDEDDNILNPEDILGKRCNVNAAIKFESIFIGSKIVLQVKLYEAVVELLNTEVPRLLTRPKPQKSVILSEENEEDIIDIPIKTKKKVKRKGK